MADLDILRPEVAQALGFIERNQKYGDGSACAGDIDIIRAELLRLAKIEEERWAVVATRNGALERAEKAEAELAALKARIAEAPTLVRQFRVVPKGSTWTDVKDDEIWAAVTTHPESYETRILYTHSAPSDAEKRDTMTPRELAKRIERGEKWKLADEPMPTRFGDETPATHYLPPTQDAERLAEALRSISNDANDTGNKFGSPDECIESIARTAEEALTAHSAQAQPASEGAMSPDAETLIGQHVSCIRAEALAIQKGVNPLNCAERIVGRCDKLAEKIRELAQPPAASATDAMVWRERVEAAAYILYLQDWCQDEDGPVDFTEAFLSSLRKKWIDGWLPARFEAHCGDCTKVAALCTRCAVEGYLSDAARLLGVPEAALAAQENPNG